MKNLLNLVKINLFYFFSPKEKISSCQICYSENLISLKKNKNLIIKLSKCKQCNIVFQNPILSEKNLYHYYSLLYRGYNSPNVEKKLFDRGSRRGKYIYDYIKNYISEEISNKRILEIGSGYGGIINTFKKNNNSVFSQEIDSQCDKFINNNLGIKNYKDINNKNLNMKKFDIIIVSHTLEHIYNITEFLNKISKLIHNTSLIYFEIPNYEENKHASNRSIQIGHLWYFNEDTIEMVLQKFNYETLVKNNKIQLICRQFN